MFGTYARQKKKKKNEHEYSNYYYFSRRDVEFSKLKNVAIPRVFNDLTVPTSNTRLTSTYRIKRTVVRIQCYMTYCLYVVAVVVVVVT